MNFYLNTYIFKVRWMITCHSHFLTLLRGGGVNDLNNEKKVETNHYFKASYWPRYILTYYSIWTLYYSWGYGGILPLHFMMIACFCYMHEHCQSITFLTSTNQLFFCSQLKSDDSQTEVLLLWLWSVWCCLVAHLLLSSHFYVPHVVQ